LIEFHFFTFYKQDKIVLFLVNFFLALQVRDSIIETNRQIQHLGFFQYYFQFTPYSGKAFVHGARLSALQALENIVSSF